MKLYKYVLDTNLYLSCNSVCYFSVTTVFYLTFWLVGVNTCSYK